MATVNKDFRIKAGLVVEGANATVNGEDIITTGSTTDNLTEGSANLYFTEARAAAAVADEIDTAVSTAINALDTDVIEEGDNNLYFTEQRAIDAVGGSATSQNDPDTVVKRDGNGGFAAGTISADRLNIGEAGWLEDDDDLEIRATEGNDIRLYANTNNGSGDVRLYAGDDIVLSANDTIRLEGANIYAGENLNFVDGERVVVRDYLSGELANYTETADLDTTVGAYGYLKSADLAGYATEAYADQAEADAIAAAALDATTKANAAYANAEIYTDGQIDALEGSLQDYADTAEQDAKDYTDTALEDYTPTSNLDTTVGGYGYLKSADLNDYATQTYVNDAVDALVDGAPGLLDTLNEIAAAIADDENYATTMTTALAGKQGTLTEGANIDITNDVISVTGLDAADISDFNAAALSATAAAYDVAGAAAAAQTAAEGFATTAANNAQAAAEDYADGLAANYETAGAAATAESNANSYTDSEIDALDTDDIEEGSNNLYFTDARAVTALEAVVPNFTAVEVNSVAKQVAATAFAASAKSNTVITWNKADYKSAKFLVKVNTGTHSQVSEILVTLDSSDNVAITEFGMVYTDVELGTVTADVSSNDVRILVTTLQASTTMTVVGTLLI